MRYEPTDGEAVEPPSFEALMAGDWVETFSGQQAHAWLSRAEAIREQFQPVEYTVGGIGDPIESQWPGHPPPKDPSEERVTDPVTGGAKGTKGARFDLLPYDALYAIATHFGRGGTKYEDRNWERGYTWSSSYAAMQRHLAAWWQGEDDDDDEVFGEYNHLEAVGFHALVLLTFVMRETGTDDRPKGAPWNPHSTRPSSSPSDSQQ